MIDTFKVGMGESPEAPEQLSSEGLDFLKKCLIHNAKRRFTADALLAHPFARAYDSSADLAFRPGAFG